MFGFSINQAQAETLAKLTASQGKGKLDGFGNPGKEGPVVFTVDDREYLLLVNGDVLDHSYEAMAANG